MIDLFFTFVFLMVMFLYSPLLTAIVLGAIPFYVGISVAATPPFAGGSTVSRAVDIRVRAALWT